MADTRAFDQATQSGAAAPALLLVTGALLAVTIIVARLAAADHAPMLWFMTLAMGGGGLVLMLAAVLTGVAHGKPGRLLPYSAGAGAFQALGTAIAYLSVAHVGAGYVALTFAFPLLLTYVLALALGMERLAIPRALGVLVALAGGLVLGLAKFDGVRADGEAAGWVLIASSIPLVLAGGNVYRTHFWPRGASPLFLASLMLLIAAALTAPVAAVIEGAAALSRLWSESGLRLLVLVNIAAFASQFAAYFKLQHVAGPVYLSQIGSVAAIVGAPVAVLWLGESLPADFALAATLIVAGAVLFQWKALVRRIDAE